MREDAKSKSSRKVAFASFVGTAVEWYDFYLYGTAAALVFNKIFFPHYEPIVGIMAAYATYAIGFFARPLGGILFGHYGDRYGRKNMLIITLSIMGLATFLIGLLPTYQQIGVTAPILLVILRCLQGIGVGGEWGGAAVMTAENSRSKERGFFASWPNAGAPFGLVVSIIIFLIVSALPEKEFLSWGWRLPFLLGLVLVAIGLYVRLHLLESPLFAKTVKRRAKLPAIEVLRTSFFNFSLAIGARFAESASFYIFTVFILSYSTEYLHLSKNLILYAVLLGAALEVFSIPFFGYLSDLYGRRIIYMSGAFLVGMFAYPFFWLIQTKSTFLIFFAVSFVLVIGHAAMHGAQAAFYAELFKTRVRYSGMAIAYHLSAAFSGGLAPLIATGLLAWTGKIWPVVVYLMLMSLITLISLYMAEETTQMDLTK